MVLISSTDESEKSAIKWMCETGVEEKWMQRMGLDLSCTIRRCNRRTSRRIKSNNKKRLRENSSAIVDSKRSRTLKEDAFIPSSSDWSGLQDVFLEVILHKLNCIRDRIRFGTVCTSWQSVYRHNCSTNHLPRQLPMLMIPNYARHTLSFLSPFIGGRGSRRNMYDLDIQIPRNSRCVGSTEGWLIIEETKKNSSSVCLLKPFLSVNNKIRLPTYWGHRRPAEVFKLVLSADPSISSDYVVMAYYLYPKTLAFCRPNDKFWTELRNCPGGYHDIICYKHQFYTVSDYDVSVWDFSTPHLVERPFMKTPHYDSTKTKKYLVEASGNMFLIYRRVSRHMPFESTTVGFEVFKMDPDQQVWNKVKSLDGHTLFLGGISSMSVLPSHFAEYCNPNCIYFGYDAIPRFGWKPFDTVVFNLEDGSFEQIFPKDCIHSIIWIEPKL